MEINVGDKVIYRDWARIKEQKVEVTRIMKVMESIDITDIGKTFFYVSEDASTFGFLISECDVIKKVGD